MLQAPIAAARLIGDGFYGVDLKQSASGVYVIEINDNPNLDLGAEDKVLGDEIYRRLLTHLLVKFEMRNEPLLVPEESTRKSSIAVSPHLLAEPIALHLPYARTGH